MTKVGGLFVKVALGSGLMLAVSVGACGDNSVAQTVPGTGGMFLSCAGSSGTNGLAGSNGGAGGISGAAGRPAASVTTGSGGTTGTGGQAARDAGVDGAGVGALTPNVTCVPTTTTGAAGTTGAGGTRSTGTAGTGAPPTTGTGNRGY